MMDLFAGSGGNYIDTADMYVNWAPGGKGGEAEKAIGDWMKSRKNRKNMVVGTKVRCRMWPGQDGEGLSRAHITKAVEKSLKRLRTDHIDLYMAHWPDAATPLEETLEAFAALVASGKVRYLGCSNFSASDLKESLALSRKSGLPGFVSTQPHYHLALRDFEFEQLALVKKNALAVFPYGAQGEGFLTGRYRRGMKDHDSARLSKVQRYFTPAGWRIVDALLAAAKEAGCTPGQLAIAWQLSKPWITAPIVGATRTDQLRESLQAVHLRIDPRILRRLDLSSRPRT